MKKYLSYILIVIAILGLFSPITKLQAATGTCVYKEVGAYNKKGEIVPYSPGHGNTPEEQCGLNSNMEWIPTGTTTPSAPITAYQKCINDGGNYASCNVLAGRPETPPATTTDPNYNLLAPLPNGNETMSTFDPTGAGGGALGGYLNLMIKLFIGICAVLAVIMIVMGGIEYMTTELISSKEAGKERIRNAILGLLLALSAWMLLNQINPNILNTDLKSLASVTVTVDLGGEGTTAITATKGDLSGDGINCTGGGGTSALVATAQSFVGRSTYSQAKRGTVSGGTAYVDCSSFVTQVYTCAGLGNPGGTTTGIFGSATSATNVSADGKTINGTALKVGDLIGWKQGENGEKNGHVMMYIGNGQMIDAQGSGVAVRPVSSYAGRIKYIKPV